MKKEYTISIYSENKVGLLSRITVIFTRRKINIESVTISECEMPGVAKYTIVAHIYEKKIEMIRRQIEKQIEVIKAYYHLEQDTVYTEIALYKLIKSADDDKAGLDELYSKFNLRTLHEDDICLFVEHTGDEESIFALFNDLEKLKNTQII